MTFENYSDLIVHIFTNLEEAKITGPCPLKRAIGIFNATDVVMYIVNAKIACHRASRGFSNDAENMNSNCL